MVYIGIVLVKVIGNWIGSLPKLTLVFRNVLTKFAVNRENRAG